MQIVRPQDLKQQTWACIFQFYLAEATSPLLLHSFPSAAALCMDCTFLKRGLILLHRNSGRAEIRLSSESKYRKIWGKEGKIKTSQLKKEKKEIT